MESVADRFPGREEQVNVLQRFLRKSLVCGPDLFIFGASGAGKTSIVRAILEESGVKFVFINCIECYEPSVLFHFILNGIAGHEPSPQNGYSNYINTRGNITTFLTSLRTILPPNEKTFLIFDKAERMTHHDFSPTLVASLFRLDELTERNVNTVFLSVAPFSAQFSVQFPQGTRDPLPIHFPSYDKETLAKILIFKQMNFLKSNNELSEMALIVIQTPIYLTSMVNLILSTFFLFLTDVNELTQLVQILLPEYLAPVLAGEMNLSDPQDVCFKLNSLLHPKLTQCVGSIGLNHVSFMDVLSTKEAQQKGKRSNRAFIASNNDKKTDLAIFGRSKDKKGRKEHAQARAGGAKEKIINQFSAPKYFSLFRLEAILDAIIDKDLFESPSTPGVPFQDSSSQSLILSEISNMVQLNFLEARGKTNKRKQVQQRYKCTVDQTYVFRIAASIGFELSSFLAR